MYDWPEIRPAIDRLWSSISTELVDRRIEAPAQLIRIEHPSTLWTDPNLIVGQTCGWPYINGLRGKVIPFARFDYGRKNCPAGYYNSAFIGRYDSDRKYLEEPDALLKAEKIAINGDDSQSGFHVFDELLDARASETIPAEYRLITGAHRNSVKAVAAGDATIAAIDSVAFELAQRYEPEAFKKIVVLGYSKPKPGLPLITSCQNQQKIEALFDAVQTGLNLLPDIDKANLLINGLVAARDADYDVFVQSA